jgi:GT2 family glycosyltransferase
VFSWNSVTSLRRCLAALGKSTWKDNTQVLVVDAGSRDGSASIDTEFPWVTMLRLPRNFGKTRARNIAIRSAAGEYLLFLDPEVELDAGATAQLVSYAQGKNEITAVGASLRDSAGRPVATAYRLPAAEDLKTACKTGRPLPAIEAPDGDDSGVSDQALLVRRVFVSGMNYLEEKRYAQFWADVEMCYQIRHAGKKITILNDARGVLHPAETSVTLDTTAQALLDADRIAGAANYIGKHDGFGSSLPFRLGFILSSLARPSLLLKLLSGQQIDGTQGGVLG